jgi:DNA-binding NarL/FixJ family response regulator
MGTRLDSEPPARLSAVVVDDDTTTALGVVTALERSGTRVVAEVSRVEEAPIGADLVCCDLVLGRSPEFLQGAAGVAFLAARGERVLALSALARAVDVGDVIGVGALGYLDRHALDWGEFEDAVAVVGRGRRFLSRSLAAKLLTDLTERPLSPARELDRRAREYLFAVFDEGGETAAGWPSHERDAALQRIWATWSRRAAAYRLELSPRQREGLRLFHQGANAAQVAGMLHVSSRTIQTDQDRIRSAVANAYGVELKREAACRLAWALVDGELVWGEGPPGAQPN